MELEKLAIFQGYEIRMHDTGGGSIKVYVPRPPLKLKIKELLTVHHIVGKIDWYADYCVTLLYGNRSACEMILCSTNDFLGHFD